jgi:hypothetical protein
MIRIGTYKGHQELQVNGLAAAMNVGRALYQINQGSVIIVNLDGYPKTITLKGTKRWTNQRRQAHQGHTLGPKGQPQRHTKS